MPPVLSKLAVSASRFLETGSASLGELAQVLEQRLACRWSAGPPTTAASPSARAPGVDGLENGPELPDEAVQVGRGAAEVGDHGRDLARRSAPRSSIERLQLAQEAAAAARSRDEVVAPLRGRLAGLVRLADEARDAAARSRASGASAWSESTRQPAQHPVLAGEDPQHLVGLAQRRVRPVDHLVQLRAAAGEAGAELVDQDREPLAVRAAA